MTKTKHTQNYKQFMMNKEYNSRILKINEYHKEIIKTISKGKLQEGDDNLFMIMSYINKINKIKRILFQKEVTLNNYIKNLK